MGVGASVFGTDKGTDLGTTCIDLEVLRREFILYFLQDIYLGPERKCVRQKMKYILLSYCSSCLPCIQVVGHAAKCVANQNESFWNSVPYGDRPSFLLFSCCLHELVTAESSTI